MTTSLAWTQSSPAVRARSPAASASPQTAFGKLACPQHLVVWPDGYLTCHTTEKLTIGFSLRLETTTSIGLSRNARSATRSPISGRATLSNSGAVGGSSVTPSPSSPVVVITSVMSVVGA